MAQCFDAPLESLDPQPQLNGGRHPGRVAQVLADEKVEAVDGDGAEVVEDVREVAGGGREVGEHPVGDALVLEHEWHRERDVEAPSADKRE